MKTQGNAMTLKTGGAFRTVNNALDSFRQAYKLFMSEDLANAVNALDKTSYVADDALILADTVVKHSADILWSLFDDDDRKSLQNKVCDTFNPFIAVNHHAKATCQELQKHLRNFDVLTESGFIAFLKYAVNAGIEIRVNKVDVKGRTFDWNILLTKFSV